jgi:hypothetical protein
VHLILPTKYEGTPVPFPRNVQKASEHPQN